jgi:hypothetical protein
LLCAKEYLAGRCVGLKDSRFVLGSCARCDEGWHACPVGASKKGPKGKWKHARGRVPQPAALFQDDDSCEVQRGQPLWMPQNSAQGPASKEATSSLGTALRRGYLRQEGVIPKSHADGSLAPSKGATLWMVHSKAGSVSKQPPRQGQRRGAQRTLLPGVRVALVVKGHAHDAMRPSETQHGVLGAPCYKSVRPQDGTQLLVAAPAGAAPTPAIHSRAAVWRFRLLRIGVARKGPCRRAVPLQNKDGFKVVRGPVIDPELTGHWGGLACTRVTNAQGCKTSAAAELP